MKKNIITIILVLMIGIHYGQTQNNNPADARFGYEFLDNPASWALDPNVFTLGVYTDFTAEDFSGEMDFDQLPFTVLLNSPLLNATYSRDRENGIRYSFGSSFSLPPYFAFGYRSTTDSTVSDNTIYDFGLIARPNGFLSLGLTYGNVFLENSSLGFGAAIRPLIFLRDDLAPMLTVSTDMVYTNEVFSVNQVSARFVWQNTLGLKAWYNWPTRTIGAGLSLQFAGAQTSLSLGNVQNPGNFRYGVTAGISPNQQQQINPLSKTTLYIDGSLPLIDSPQLAPGFLGQSRGLSFNLVVQAIEKAAQDPAIQALVLEEIPSLTSLAKAQELGRALKTFQESGKPVYVYARRFTTLDYIYLASLADFIGIDYYGSVILTDVRAGSLYVRGFTEKLGVRFFPLRSHEYKSGGNIFTEYGMTDAEREAYTRMVQGMANQNYTFLDSVRSAKLSDPSAYILAQGPYLTARSAKNAGLIDEILFLDEFRKHISNELGNENRITIQNYMAKDPASWGERPFSQTVAVVHLNGNIIEGNGIAGQNIGTSAAEGLRALRENRSIKGIILRVDSGGGSALISEHIAREVQLAVESGLPVYVSMSGYAASGGYYLSAPATRIYAEEGTITGSIGVLGLAISTKELLENLGIQADFISASDSSDFGDIFQNPRERDMEIQEDMLRYVYDRFVEVVAEGRNLPIETVDELGQGQIWLGSEALENGLIDAIGGLSQVKADMATKLGGSVVFRDYVPGTNPATGVFEFILPLLGVNLPNLNDSSLVPTAVRSTWNLISSLDEMGNGPLMLLPDYLYRDQDW